MKNFAAAGAAPIATAPRSPAAMFSAARQWLLYRDTSDTLTKLSRRELADIGVEESADEFAWRMAADRTAR